LVKLRVGQDTKWVRTNRFRPKYVKTVQSNVHILIKSGINMHKSILALLIFMDPCIVV